MALLLLLAMLTVCAATPRDMSGKMFTFPQETSSAHVRLTTSRQVLTALTVCQRFLTDTGRAHTLVSLATPSTINGFLIIKNPASLVDLFVRNAHTGVGVENYSLNSWHSICSTWESTSGLGQVWLNGKPSARRFTSVGSISGPILIVLGQDQDSYGGGFDSKQSFVGMMSDVHMWDYVLSPCQIQSYMKHQTFPPGNLLNWRSLEFQTAGRVLVENNQTCY